ncbi:hypothetical protein [Telluribacter sp.]|uniref:hypothetical protein n=1 Tax=Telluribacter sp. TaxID=1978767 RepID=UPI002E14A99C|nr:hypothetical protein [Telluribacter sp.]
MPSLFFALVAVWLLTKDGWKRVIAALACVVIAVSAFSSGLLGYGAGALVLFLRKRWGYLAIWCLAAILTAALYFRNYTQPGWGLPEFSPYDNPLSVWLLIRYIILYIGGILHFHPTSVSESTIYNPAHWGSYLLGLASSSIIMYTLLVAWAGNWPFLAKRIPEWMQKKSDWWQRYPRIRLFITGAVALLFVTIYMVVNGRTTPEYGDQLFKPRLILYPTITVAMAYMMALWLAGRFRQRVFVTSLFLALIYCFLSYFYRIDSRIREKRFHTTSLYNYLHNKPGFMNDFGTWGGGNQKYNKPNVDSAILAGVYKPTDPAFLRHARLVSPERTDLPKLTIKYDSRNNTYTFRSRDLRIAYRHYQNYYLVLRSSASQFVLSLTPGQTSLTYFLRTGQYYAGDIATDVTAFSLPEGKYRVGVLAHLNNPYYSFQPDSITIQRKRPSEWW